MRPFDASDTDLIRLLQMAMHHMREPVIITDALINRPGPVIRYVNPAFTRLSGYTLEEIAGKTPRILQGPATDRRVLDRLRHCMETGDEFHGEAINYRKDGSTYFLEWRMAPIRDDAGTITHWVAIQQDITDRRRLEKEVLEASVREQQRLGRDLHDGIGQHLTGMALIGRALAQRLERRADPDAADAAQVADLAEEVLDQTRRLAHALFPPDVAAHGLVIALEDLMRTTRLHTACSFSYDVPVILQDAVIASNVYHIAQEAVRNAVQHSGATHLTLTLSSDGATSTLAVHDDGRGFQYDPYASLRHGLGLRIMHYRASALGARLHIESQAGTGTTVTLQFPNNNDLDLA